VDSASRPHARLAVTRRALDRSLRDLSPAAVAAHVGSPWSAKICLPFVVGGDHDDSVAVPSAASKHLPWDQVPPPIHRWAESLVGPVVEATSCEGGMSPGCVVVLRGRDDAMFLKAVGSELNPRTPKLYRHEAEVLPLLPQVSYRPALRGVFDDGGWVALALEPIDGQHPDLTKPGHRRAVCATLARQSAELSALRPPIATLADLAADWLKVWSDERTAELQPDWLRVRRTHFGPRVARLPDRLPPHQLVHWDARDDNLLIRPDGSVVIFDWGMSRLGPQWADLFVLALRNAAVPDFDDEVEQIPDLIGHGPNPDLIDDFLLLFGTRLAFMSKYRPEKRIPAMTAFRKQQSEQMLEGARRRLGL
jgi:hypothetical protein